MTTQRHGNGPWIVVVIAGIIAAMHVWKLPSALTLVRADLGIDLVQAGLLLGLVQVAGMVGGLPVSIMGERIGLRRGLVAGLVLLVVGTAISALSPTAAVLMVARVIEGVGFIMVTVMAPALIRRDTPVDKLTTALGFWTSFQGTATFLALLGGAVFLQVVGWRAWYWFMAAITAVIIPVLLRFTSPDPPSEADLPAAFRRVGATLRTWQPWVAGLVFTAYTIQWSALIGFLPTIYEGHHLSPVTGGALSAVAGGLNGVGAILAGQLLQRGARPRPLVIFAFIVMAGSASGFFVVPWQSLAPQFVLVCLFSFTGAIIPTTLYRIAVDLAPPKGSPPAVIGLIQQTQNIGSFVGPIILAWIAAAVGGWHASWWHHVAASVVGIALMVLFSPKNLSTPRS